MGAQTEHFYDFGPFRIDAIRRLLLEEQKPVPLTSKTFEVLLLLVRRRGEVVEKDELMKAVWADTVVEENSVTKHVSTLRKALGEKADQHRYLVTVPGRGYSFVASVTESTNGGGERVLPESAEAGAEIARPVSPGLAARRKGWLVAAAMVALTVAATAYFLSSRSARAAPFQKIGISRLTNTGNSSRGAISPDGKYVAHVVGDAGQHRIRMRALATGSEVEIVPPAGATYGGLTFSRDSNYLYYGAQETNQPVTILYRVPVLGGQPKKLKAGLDSPISLSPEGDRFAFVREDPGQGESVLWIADEDGDREQRVVSRKLPEFLDYPAWSPDGKRIACTVVSSERSHVNVMEVGLDTGADRQIATYPGYVRLLKWLSDGRGLVMTAMDQASGVYSVWHLSYPGGEVRRITNNLDDFVAVSVTNDSRALVTVEDKLLSSLWIAPREKATGARQILFGASKYSRASWTPDGRILYEKQAGDRRSLWLMDSNGSNQKQLTIDGGYRASACPDGRYVVYVAQRGGAEEIWRVNIDGANPRRLTSGNGEPVPQCSPDGNWVIYTSLGSLKWQTLWKTSIDGAHSVQLNDKFLHRPAISPDGRWIACFSQDYQTSQQNPAKPTSIAILPFEGRRELKVVPIPQTVFEPAGIRWTPDGRLFTYVDNRCGISNIWGQPLAGGPAMQLTDFKGDRILHFDWSPDGKQLLFSRGARTYDLVLIRDLR